MLSSAVKNIRKAGIGRDGYLSEDVALEMALERSKPILNEPLDFKNCRVWEVGFDRTGKLSFEGSFRLPSHTAGEWTHARALHVDVTTTKQGLIVTLGVGIFTAGDTESPSVSTDDVRRPLTKAEAKSLLDKVVAEQSKTGVPGFVAKLRAAAAGG